MKRFWDRVDIRGHNDCWNWLGHTNTGYGRLTLNKRCVYAHRLAWTLIEGSIPEGLDILHRCDNPRCCNTAHLFPGTHAENMADMASKGRHVAKIGVEHWQCKVTPEEVLEARRLLANGELSIKLLAQRYGLSYAGMWNALRGRRSWAYLPDPVPVKAPWRNRKDKRPVGRSGEI
jgi:hypothetical protein